MAGQLQQLIGLAAQHQHVNDAPYGIFIEEDMIDDSTGIIPMIGLDTPLSLKDRFVRRLSKMLGTGVSIRETPSSNAMDIFLTQGKYSPQPSVALDGELRKFARALEDALADVARASTDHQLVIAKKDLWDVVLTFNDSKIDQVIRSIRKSFEDNQATFDQLVTRMFGIYDLDNEGSTMDHELGDRIISLSESVRGFDGSMKELESLAELASRMAREFIHLHIRLRSLIGKTRFADKLYELICTLGFLERVHSTLVRSARTSQTFRNVSFHFRPNPPTKTVSFATPIASLKPQNTIKPSSPPLQQEMPKRVKRVEATEIAPTAALPNAASHPRSPSAHPPRSAAASLGPLMTAVQPYLARSDRNLALVRLQPVTKQQTAQLVGTVLQGKPLPKQTTAWYTFGFVTAKDEDEERRLAGLYLNLLREADDFEAIFRELQTALENNSLVALFDKHQYKHFRNLFPYLELFLDKLPTKRFTIWRLRQFIEDPIDDEPPACLQRDYGFKFCRQREEVLRLKEIYKDMLRKMGPMKLHNACTNGRLFERATQRGVHVNGKDKRFLANDYPSPFVGLDNEGGLEAYRGPFFRKVPKL